MELGAGVFAVNHLVTLFQGHFVVLGARTDGDDGALLGFFFSGIRDDDATGGFLLGGGGFDHHAVCQRFDG